MEGQSQSSSVACVSRYPSFINMSSEPTEIHATLNFPNIAGSQSLLLRRVILYVKAQESTKSWWISLGITGHLSWKGETSGKSFVLDLGRTSISWLIFAWLSTVVPDKWPINP